MILLPYEIQEAMNPKIADSARRSEASPVASVMRALRCPKDKTLKETQREKSRSKTGSH